MNKFKKGLVALALVGGMVLAGFSAVNFKNAKANNIEKTSGNDYVRNTNLSVDSSGTLNVNRNILGDEPMGDKGTWTIFVYMCGSDLETNYQSASTDIKEMISGAESDKVNIVIQTGGAAAWNKPCIDANKIGRYVIKNNRMELIESHPDANMGDGDTLKSFLKWGVKEYPAEKMGLVFWNHGGGTLGGVCCDEKNGMDSLSLVEIEKSLYETSKIMTDKFEFIGFDACLMATIETANVLVPYANYMIASEQVESCEGWYYKPFIDAIVKNPNIDGKEVGKVIVDGFMQVVENFDEELQFSTLSVTDLSKVDDAIIAFNEVAKQIDEQSTSGEKINEFLTVAVTSLSEGCGDYDYGMVDLYNYMDKIAPFVNGTEKVKEAIQNMVVYEKHGTAAPNAHGITFYYPTFNCGMVYLNLMRNVIVSPYYMNYLDKVESYTMFTYEDAQKQGFLDENYNPVEGKDTSEYVPSPYTLQNYVDNNWENSKYYFDTDYEFMDYEFNSMEEYEEIRDLPYYSEASFDDNWYNLYQ